MRSKRGFTLLEVMVAVAILGLGLTAILSAQAGAFAASAHARNLSLATGLARCKMSELEEQLLRDGFQELEVNEVGPCCDGEDFGPIHCSWKIVKPELPPPKLGELDLDTDVGSSKLDPLAALAGDNPGAALGPDAGVGALAAAVTGGVPGSEGGGLGGIASIAMGMVYPDLKALFEASTRRVTVTLSWKEGNRDHSFDLVQWITKPQESLKLDELENEAAAEAADLAESAGSQSGSSQSGSGSGKGSTGSGSMGGGKPPPKTGGRP
jgi:general secretion pathway protein I